MTEDVDGVGDRDGRGGLRGCRTSEGDGEDIEEGRVFGSVFRLSALSSMSDRCSLAFKRSWNTAKKAFVIHVIPCFWVYVLYLDFLRCIHVEGTGCAHLQILNVNFSWFSTTLSNVPCKGGLHEVESIQAVACS